MIDFEKLDKRRIYLGLQYGEGFISKKIRKYSKCYAPKSAKVPTHVLAFVFKLGEWWVYESHATGFKKLGVPAGVRRYTVEKWKIAEEHAQEQFVAVPLKIKFKDLEKYIGQEYGGGDIRNLLKAALFHSNGKQKDRDGLICSEYIALCFNPICKYYDLPAWCITPAHFQDYIDNTQNGEGEEQ